MSDRTGARTHSISRRNLVKIFPLLRSRTGHDFSHYKDSTLLRRVRRRMQVLQLLSVEAYVDRLRSDAQESEALFRDLLIGVTHFFRDAQAFEALQDQVIPKLLDARAPEHTVRVWVAGCATGQEAYSIAMLFREQTAQRDQAPKVQIFATDIDDHALEVARRGVYPEAIASDASPTVNLPMAHLLRAYGQYISLGLYAPWVDYRPLATSLLKSG